ncbi:MAG: hypothetical protein M0009_10935 [Deltaproteobacteria bacterium]|nr:hypothetical protein [Deltaproteobacteria bacterium]
MAGQATSGTRRWPTRGWVGLALIACFWPLNWCLTGLRTHWGFFPLWLGYALAVDALVFCRKGHSLFTRSPAAYAGLFCISAPAWWLFEWLNLRLQNWFYLGETAFTTCEYALLSTVSFSTVMPAVFGTAELAATWGPIRRIGPGPVLRPTPAFLGGMFMAGGVMLFACLRWPDRFFPLLWISLYGLIEPLNVRLKNRSLLDDLSRGDWRPVIALCAGCLICGFFWEMWNYYSYPKWIYRIPYAAWLPLFEMPLAGYLGYLPFSLELFALYHLVTGLPGLKGRTSDLCLTDS